MPSLQKLPGSLLVTSGDATDPDSVSDESIIWKGSPSQILNFWPFTICLLIDAGFIVGAFWFPPLLIGCFLPVIYAVWKFMEVRCRIFELTSQRLRLYSGVLNQDIAEIELYRVKDTNISRPFIPRLFGLSDITLDTSDRTHPTVLLPAIKNGVEVREHLRNHVEIIRDQKRVREVDFESSDGDDMEFGDDIG